MKITKYAQSCFLIETKGKRILIDPGDLVDEETISGFEKINFLLFTHKHNDHCYVDFVKKILEENNPEIIANSEVVEKLVGFETTIMREGDKKDFGGVEIEMTKAVHGYIPAMKGSKAYPKETNGFIISDGQTSVYHCGDTICFENDYKADVVLVPICGHAVVMDPLVAIEFAEDVGAKLIIPMHYDSDKHILGTDKFEELAKEHKISYKILKDGESIEI